jgi:glyoxylase-like metal-dependent hydrolase (beta-lactamase superfamily II)
MNRWKVGDVTITRVVEAEELWDGTLLLPGATADAVKKEPGLYPAFTTEEGQFRLSIHAFVLESQGKRIIVDTCVGNDKSRSIPQWDHLHGPFPERLIEAGHPREAIDRVICTHLHLDHVGWNTTLVNDKWTATFPNAKYLVHGTEWDFFSKTEDEFLKGPVEDSVRPVMDEGRCELVNDGYKITDEVWLEPTPGHTPGHTSIRISSKGADAVITGDMIHHPIQFRHPEWDNNFDCDGKQAKATRRAFCERYAEKPVRVFGTHFAAQAGRIVKKGAAFDYVLD